MRLMKIKKIPLILRILILNFCISNCAWAEVRNITINCPTEATVISLKALTYELYSIVLKELKWFSDEKNDLVIRQKTTADKLVEYDTGTISKLREQFGLPDDSLFVKFKTINAESVILEECFDNSLNIILLSKEEENEIFNTVESSWEKFYAKYPKSKGIIELSRIAFNPDKMKALLYCGGSFDRGKGGIGYYILLKQENGNWLIEKKITVWIS